MMIIDAIGAFVIYLPRFWPRPLAVIGFPENPGIYNELITPPLEWISEQIRIWLSREL